VRQAVSVHDVLLQGSRTNHFSSNCGVFATYVNVLSFFGNITDHPFHAP